MGERGFSQVLCARPGAVPHCGDGAGPAPRRSPRGPACSQACSLPWPGILRVRGDWEVVCPAADQARPCPHSSCLPGPVASQTDRACESWGPPRRAWLPRQLLKGLIVAGPSVGSCSAVGANRAQPLCRSTAPALTWALVCGRLGASLGRGCLGPSGGPGWVWSLLADPGTTPPRRGWCEARALTNDNSNSIATITTSAAVGGAPATCLLTGVCARGLTGSRSSPTDCGRAVCPFQRGGN